MARRLLASFAVVGLTTALAAGTSGGPASARPSAVRAGGDAAATFRTVPTARLLDTRTGTGAPKAPLAGRRSLSLTVLGRGGVPATGVSAVALTLTVTRPAAGGYLSVYPTGADRPVTSNVNFAAGQTQATAAVVRVGDGGRIDLFNGATGAAQVVADVSGYYLDGDPTAPGSFGAPTPARLLDTRESSPVPAGGTVDVPVTGQAGLPSGNVSAAVVSITAVSPTASGYLTAYAKGADAPATSTVNFAAGGTVANLAVVAVGAGGAITVGNASADATNVLVDVAGYYLDGAPTAGGAYQPVTPTRIRDTRSGIGGTKGAVASQQAISFSVQPDSESPATRIAAVAVNVTATAAAAHGYVTAYRPTSSIPTASTLDFVPGRSSADLAIVPVGPDGKIALYNGSSGSVQLIADIVGYYVLPTPQVEAVPDSGSFDASAVSCAPGLCLALGTSGNSATEYSTYTGSSWSTPKDVPGLLYASDVSCRSSSFCLVTDSTFQHSVEFDGTSFAAPVALPSGFDAFDNFDFDCGSPTLCVVEAGNSRGENNAARYDGTSWSLTPPPPFTTFALSCEAADCTIVSGTHTARFDGSTWTSLAAGPATNNDSPFSCAASRCLEISATSSGSLRSAVLTNGSWSTPIALPAVFTEDPVAGLSCVSATWCMFTARAKTSAARSVVDYAIFNGTSWSTPASANGIGASPFGGNLSCASTTLCARANGALSTWNGGWSTTAAFPGQADDVSCVSATSCLAVDDRGYGQTYDGSAWTSTPPAAGMGTLRAVSCASATRCVAVGQRLDNSTGAVVWNGTSWSTSSAISGMGYAGDVSCTSTTFCLAVGGVHDNSALQPYQVSTADTAQWSRYGGASWTSAAGIGTSLVSTQRVSCTSSTFCAAVASKGTTKAVPVIFTGTSWAAYPTSDYPRITMPVSCAAGTTTCLATGVYRDPYLRVLKHSGSGTAWTEGYGINGDYTLAVSCTASSYCVAGGGAFTDGDAVSPAVWLYDGSGWSTRVLVDGLSTNGIGTISCVGTAFCAVTGTYINTDPGD